MFPVATATLVDRDGTVIREISLTRFWNAPPKILIENKNEYYVRISDDNVDPIVYRRTNAVRHIESMS